MPSSAHTSLSGLSTSSSMVPALMASTAVALGGLGVGLLIAGTALGPPALLGWGTVLCTLAIAVGCLTVVRMTIDDAVNRCVNRVYTAMQVEVEEAVSSTAVKVGLAIAEGLLEREDDPRPPTPRAGVSQLY